MLKFGIEKIASGLNNLPLVETFDVGLLRRLVNLKCLDNEHKKLLLTYLKNSNTKKGNNDIIYQKGKCGFGRVFPKGNMSLGMMWHKIRHSIANKHYIDIDMVNSQPTILYQICQANNTATPNLESYINNRDIILEDVKAYYKCDRTTAKQLFIILMNSGTFNCWKSDNINNITITDNLPILPFIKNFTNELKSISSHFVLANPKLFKLKQKEKPKHPEASTMATVLQEYECRILEVLFETLGSPKNASLAFDGLMVPPDTPYSITDLIKSVEDKLGFKILLEIKPMDKGFTQEEMIFEEDPDSFEFLNDEFNKTHFLIVNKSVYCKIVHNANSCINHIYMSESQLMTSYKHLPNKFIKQWINDNPNIRKYADVGIFPPPLTCPKDHYNLWTPFSMELVKDYTENIPALDKILNHIKILSNHDQNVYEYLVKWIAQFIQLPAIKTTTPCFISKQGAGKTGLIQLFKNMLGDAKYLETSEPERDIWGTYTTPDFVDAFIVSLSETSKKSTAEYHGRIKKLQTDNSCNINIKNATQFKINSYHRFIMATNNDDPMPTSTDDRRNLIIRSSDELIGNTEYFTELYGSIADINVIKTCYEYFKNLPDIASWDFRQIPETEHQEALKTISISVPEQYVEHLVRSNLTSTSYYRAISVLYTEFNEWCKINGIKYEICSAKLSMRLKALNIVGIKHIKGRAFNSIDFDIKTLMEYFKIPILVEIITEEHNQEIDQEDF